MEIANAQASYQGSKQNGINSASKVGGTRSVIFQKAKKVAMVTCETTGSDPQFAGPVSTKFTVNCPKACAGIPLVVFGSGLYSDDSSICQAALHNGLIADSGGEVIIEIQEGKNKYKAENENGLGSAEKGEYMRSFSFVGKKGNACAYFREGYNPADIFSNYYRMDYMRSVNGPSEWSFNKNPEKDGALVFEQAIPIKATGNGGYFGTYLLRKNFQCPNALIRVNTYFKTIGRSAILFRFASIDNYLALEFNGKDAPVRLIQKEGQVVKELMGVTDNQLYAKTWYRWRIYYNGKDIKVFYQNHNIRKIFKLFITKNEEDAWRGTVGLATDEADGVIFDGLQVTEPDDTYLEKGEK